MGVPTKAKIGAGLALDLAGMALVVSAIPDADWKLGAGLALMLVGTWLVSSSLRGPAPTAPPPAEVERAKKRWNPERELRSAPPRRVRLSPTAKVVVMAWSLMLLVGGAYAYFAVFSRNPGPPMRNLIDAEGSRAEATVHRREVRENGDGAPRYSLYYNFSSSDGSAIRSSVTVSKLLFDRFHEGDRLEVVYLPGDALAHYLPQVTRPPFAERGLLMALVALAFVVFLLESRRRRHHRLVQRGAATAGIVEKVRRRGGARAYEVRFRANGREGTLKATERNPLRRNGDVLTVLTDGDDAELYQQCLYRAV
ncbi:MAG: hypothetical protein KDC27_10160 [Acidobacteria bacterium]|nr:hypothetical protein [Acidobacteriota bacterium]